MTELLGDLSRQTGDLAPQDSTTGGSSSMDPAQAAPRAASPFPWLSCSSTTTPTIKRRKKQRRCSRNGHISRSCSSTQNCSDGTSHKPASRFASVVTTSPVDQQAPPWNWQHEDHSCRDTRQSGSSIRTKTPWPGSRGSPGPGPLATDSRGHADDRTAEQSINWHPSNTRGLGTAAATSLRRVLGPGTLRLQAPTTRVAQPRSSGPRGLAECPRRHHQHHLRADHEQLGQ